MIAQFLGFEWASDKIARRFKEEKERVDKKIKSTNDSLGKLKDLINKNKENIKKIDNSLNKNKKELIAKIEKEIQNFYKKLADFPDFRNNRDLIAAQAGKIENMYKELINIKDVSAAAYNFAVQIQKNMKVN